MAFDNVLFPLQIEVFESAPEYSTTVIITGNGSEQRISNWQDARVTYNAAPGIRSEQDIKLLLNFFRARKGAARGFLVTDHLDHEAQGDLFGVGDGSEREFQLRRVYSDAGNSDIRLIYKPVNTTVTIYNNAVIQSEGTLQVETQTASGTITGSGDLDVIITASGMTGSPKTIEVPVLLDDSSYTWAKKVRDALNSDVDVSVFFTVGGSNDKVILTKNTPASNDATINIDFDLGGSTATGFTDAPTSSNTVAGVDGDMAINYNTGVVTFKTAPVLDNPLTWDGDFYIPCRFQDDSLPIDQIFINLEEDRMAGGIPDIILLETRDFQ